MHKIARLMPLFIAISPLASAKNFSFDLSAAAGESDNVLKTYENETSEMQNRYSVSLRGDWNAEWMKTNLQYTGYKETFADESQEGQNYLQGDSAVHFGTTQSLLNLELRHSRRTLLKEVEDKPLVGNQEEREILSAMPGLNFNLNSNNDVIMYADMSRTRYLETELRDSDRNTYGIDINHDFSATDKLRLEFGQTETDFVYFQQSDYSLQTAALVYEVNLRKVSYSLGVGQQRIEPEFGEKADNDHYQASLGYKFGGHDLRVHYDRSITDTSYGQGFDLAIADVPVVDATSNQIGLIERSSSGVDISTTSLCVRCTLTLGYTEADDHYIGTESNSNQRSITFSLNYLISNRTRLLLNHGVNDQEPVVLNAPVIDEYKQEFSRLVLRFDFLHSLSLDIFTEREKRKSDLASRRYTENFTGLSLNYHFE